MFTKVIVTNAVYRLRGYKIVQGKDVSFWIKVIIEEMKKSR